MKHSDAVTRIANFLLNSLEKSDAPLIDMTSILDGDEKLAHKVLIAWRTLALKNFSAWRRMQEPEPGDITLRSWIVVTLQS